MIDWLHISFGFAGCAPSAADVKPALNFAFRKPFPHLIFPDFFQGPIDAVEETLLAQKFSFLSTDLLQLSQVKSSSFVRKRIHALLFFVFLFIHYALFLWLLQTKELSRDKAKEFADLTATLRDEVRPWVETITSMWRNSPAHLLQHILRLSSYFFAIFSTDTELSAKIDMRGAKYAYTGQWTKPERWSALSTFDLQSFSTNLIYKFFFQTLFFRFEKNKAWNFHHFHGNLKDSGKKIDSEWI